MDLDNREKFDVRRSVLRVGTAMADMRDIDTRVGWKKVLEATLPLAGL